VAGSRFNGQYDALNFGNGGLALTYAGFTVGGNIIGGRLNGQLALAPQHGVGELAYMFGAKYVTGPVTVGVSAERGYYQGNVNLTGITQRRGEAIDFGASYAVALGFLMYAEYQYQTLYQGGFNFITGGIGSGANNTISSQGFLIGNVVNFQVTMLTPTEQTLQTTWSQSIWRLASQGTSAGNPAENHNRRHRKCDSRGSRRASGVDRALVDCQCSAPFSCRPKPASCVSPGLPGLVDDDCRLGVPLHLHREEPSRGPTETG
jgi:hypothetical protein